MRNLVISISVMLALVSCAPDMPKQEPSYEETPTSFGEISDSTTTIIYSTEDTLEDLPSISIQVYNNRVIIESPNVNTIYTVDASKLVVHRTETGLIQYIQIDNDILFKEGKVGTNHNYRFKTPNILEAQAGNTILGIMADYKISKKQFYECNPYLKHRGLQIGDHVLINCN